jgi:hypothetical protein
MSVSRDELQKRLAAYGCKFRADIGGGRDLWIAGWGEPFVLRRWRDTENYHESDCLDVALFVLRSMPFEWATKREFEGCGAPSVISMGRWGACVVIQVVVAATWENMDSSPGDLLFGMVHILTPDGKPVPIPFSLDGGEGKEIMVQIPVHTSGDVAAALNAMEQHQPAPRLLNDVEEQLFAHAGLDFAGNKVTPTTTSEGRVTAWKRERRFAKLTRLVVLKTRRGKLFRIELTYPADANEVPSGSER